MHCDAFSSSLHLCALGLSARSAVARGPAPWTPAEEHSPSDSLVFLAFGLAEQVVQRVRYSLSQ
jgi:hypothetical protein